MLGLCKILNHDWVLSDICQMSTRPETEHVTMNDPDWESDLKFVLDVTTLLKGRIIKIVHILI